MTIWRFFRDNLLEHMASQMEVFHFCRPLPVAVWKVVYQCLGAPGGICPGHVWSTAQDSGVFFFFQLKMDKL